MIAELKPVEYKRYATLEAVMAAHWGVDEADFAEEGNMLGCANEAGDTIDIPIAEALEDQRGAGFWGYAETKTGLIHFWLDPAIATPADIVNFFAHELKHIESHSSAGNGHAEEMRCEREAMETGTIAMRAYEAMLTFSDRAA